MTQIAGLKFELLNHINYGNACSIPDYEIGFNPIIKVENIEKNKFIVSICNYLPEILFPIKDTPSSSFPIKESQIYIQYNGITSVQTQIPTTNPDSTIICRDFNLIYDSKEPNPESFCFHSIVFEYSFEETDALNAEAIIVKDENLDPETSRGTVSTPANPTT